MPQSSTILQRTLLVASLFIGLWACDGQEKPPGDLISEEKMVNILTDIHIAEAKTTNMQLRSLDSSVIVYGELQKQIWAKYKVDTLLYQRSYSFYTSHPSYLTAIYEQVEKKMEAKEKKKPLNL